MEELDHAKEVNRWEPCSRCGERKPGFLVGDDRRVCFSCFRSWLRTFEPSVNPDVPWHDQCQRCGRQAGMKYIIATECVCRGCLNGWLDGTDGR